ncbi:hypothetical protein HZS_7330 [Henneguya salminicola]|nr:hypothetical protein HZS_7330 [Henneguya salminicola]
MYYPILLSIQTDFDLIQISIELYDYFTTLTLECVQIQQKAPGIHLNTKFLNEIELILKMKMEILWYLYWIISEEIFNGVARINKIYGRDY